MEYNLITRIWIIVIAILFGFSIFELLIVPYLKSKCIIYTNSCIQIQYQQIDNSVLVHMIPTGWWVWFDGKQVLIYGEPTGRVCNDGFEAVFVYDVQQKKEIGYLCAKSLTDVQDFYKNAPYQYIYNRTDTSNFNVYSMINFLADKRIINLDYPATPSVK